MIRSVIIWSLLCISVPLFRQWQAQWEMGLQDRLEQDKEELVEHVWIHALQLWCRQDQEYMQQMLSWNIYYFLGISKMFVIKWNRDLGCRERTYILHVIRLRLRNRANFVLYIDPISGALITFSFLLILNSQCEEGARDSIDIWYVGIRL